MYLLCLRKQNTSFIYTRIFEYLFANITRTCRVHIFIKSIKTNAQEFYTCMKNVIAWDPLI